MADDRDFRADMQRIGGLVQEIESIADPAVRATTKDLMQSLMDLHGAALEKALGDGQVGSDRGQPAREVLPADARRQEAAPARGIALDRTGQRDRPRDEAGDAAG